MTKQKVRFIQLEFYTLPEENCDYMVIVEVVNDIPRDSYTVRLPAQYSRLPRSPFIMN